MLRGGIAATKIDVRTSETGVVRTAAHIAALVTEAQLPDRVRERSLATFGALAAAEGRLHRRPPAQVHFHEVGGMDAIIDVVGACAALEVLGVDEIRSSTVATGTGMVRAAHGLLPNPAPAVVELLASVGAPTHGLDVGVELVTPTGAALLASLATGFGPLPAMSIGATGFGAGTRELDGRPNLLQVVLGSPVAEAVPGQPVVQLEVNVDDATGETIAHAIAALLEAGAHDAWVTPILMKKGRPAHTVARACRSGAGRSGRTRARRRDRVPRRARLDPGTMARGPHRRPGRGGWSSDPGQDQPRPGEGRARRCGPRRQPDRPPAARGRVPRRRRPDARCARHPSHRLRPTPSPPEFDPLVRTGRLGADGLCAGQAVDMTLLERCDRCRFDREQYDRRDGLGTLRSLPFMYRWAVEGVPHERLTDAPEPARPSVAASVASVASTLASLAALVVDGEAEVPCEAGGVDGRDDVPGAQRRLDAAALEVHDNLRRLEPGPAWSGPLRYGDQMVDADWALHHAVHASTHGLREVGRTLHELGLGAPTQEGSLERISVSGGGVPKVAVDVADVGDRGVLGDRQAARQHHGRPWQALSLWSAEVIDALRREGHPIEPGAAGENLTVSGVDWSTIRPGTRILAGEVVLDVSSWAPPCSKNARWFVGGDFSRMDHDLHPGWSRAYAWVLEPGRIATGDPLIVEP